MWDVNDPNHSVVASIVLTALCPLILFALMIIFLSSFTHMSGKTQSNVSAFAMANVLRRFFCADHQDSVPRTLSLLSVVLASMLIVYFDFWCKPLPPVLEEEEEMVAFDRQKPEQTQERV